MNKARLAILGTISELHRQPIRYDLGEVARITRQVQPDLLGVEVEREDYERGDLSRAPVEVREALVPMARLSDTVVVPLGGASGAELRAPGQSVRAVVVRILDDALTAVQKAAGDARRVNSALVSHTCALVCHLEEQACGPQGRRAWEATNAKILENILQWARRDPEARILIAVQCRRKHWLVPKLARAPEIELVDYWEL